MAKYSSSRSGCGESMSSETEFFEMKTSNVVFKDHPLFDNLGQLLKPSILNPKYTETVLSFGLTSAQINAIIMSGKRKVQILLRFCSNESKCEQEDHFPLGISYVSVNSRMCCFPETYNCWTQIPINITPLCILSPNFSNQISIPFVNYSFVLGVFLVRKVCSDEPIEERRVCTLDLTRDMNKTKSSHDSDSENEIISETRNLCPYFSKEITQIEVSDPELTRAMIKRKLSLDPDSEASTLSLNCSLLCPLGKIRIQIPCRAITCTHIQCFDVQLYIQMNRKTKKWVCPICIKPSPFDNLIIDGLFNEIINKAPNYCTEVKFDTNANWTPIVAKKENPSYETLDLCKTKRYVSPQKFETKRPEIEIISFD